MGNDHAKEKKKKERDYNHRDPQRTQAASQPNNFAQREKKATKERLEDFVVIQQPFNPNVRVCPHCTIPTDCRICGPVSNNAPPVTTTTTTTTTFTPAPPVLTHTRPALPNGAFQHDCGHVCEVTYPESCCSCGDRRLYSADGKYSEYIDGQGYSRSATRWQYYCPTCKANQQWRNDTKKRSSNTRSSARSSSNQATNYATHNSLPPAATTTTTTTTSTTNPVCYHGLPIGSCRLCAENDMLVHETLRAAFQPAPQPSAPPMDPRCYAPPPTDTPAIPGMVPSPGWRPMPSSPYAGPNVPPMAPMPPSAHTMPPMPPHPMAPIHPVPPMYTIPPMQQPPYPTPAMPPYAMPPSMASVPQQPYQPPQAPAPEKPTAEKPPEDADTTDKPNTTGECVVCLDARAEMAVIPCGHLCLCKADAERLRQAHTSLRRCPVCRGPLESVLKIFT